MADDEKMKKVEKKVVEGAKVNGIDKMLGGLKGESLIETKKERKEPIAADVLSWRITEALKHYGHSDGVKLIKEVESYASKRGIEIKIPEVAQATFDEVLGYGGIDCAKSIEAFASKRGIELKIRPDMLQLGFETVLKSEYISKVDLAKEIEAFAVKRGVELELQSVLQAVFDTGCSEEIASYASARKIEIKMQEAIQAGFEADLLHADIDSAKGAEIFASKKKIELKIRPEVLQTAFEQQLADWTTYAITLIKNYASKKGVKIRMRPELLQAAFEQALTEGSVYGAREIKTYASRNGIKIKTRPGVMRTILQTAFETDLAEGSAEDADEIAAYASKNGIKLKMRPDLLQLGFEKILEIMDYHLAQIEVYASKEGIELKIRPDVLQLGFEKFAFSYVHVHADRGEELSEEAKRLLAYSTVHGIKLKTDFKHDPTDLALETKAGGMSIAIYCRKPDSELGGFGKYVIGLDKDTNEIKLIFDNRLFTHEMICKAYNLVAWGGGKMTINKERREMGIFGKSQMFGPAPDSVVIRALTTAFPEYKIVKETLPPESD